MVGAIDLHAKMCVRAVEVQGVGADGILSAKTKAEGIVAHQMPKTALGQGH